MCCRRHAPARPPVQRCPATAARGTTQPQMDGPVEHTDHRGAISCLRLDRCGDPRYQDQFALTCPAHWAPEGRDRHPRRRRSWATSVVDSKGVRSGDPVCPSQDEKPTAWQAGTTERPVTVGRPPQSRRHAAAATTRRQAGKASAKGDAPEYEGKSQSQW